MEFIKKHWKALLFSTTAVIMVLLIADGIYVSTKPERAKQLAAEALALFQNGDIAHAQEKIYKAASMAPSSLAVVRAEAKVLNSLLPSQTVEIWNRAVTLSGGAVEDRQGLAGALIAAGELEKAQGLLNGLLKDSADDPNTKLIEIAFLASNGRVSEALSRVISLTVRYPSRQEFWIAYGQLVAVQRDPAAIKSFLTAIKPLGKDRGNLGLWALSETLSFTDDADFKRAADALLAHPLANRAVQLNVILMAKAKMNLSNEAVHRQAERYFNMAQRSEQRAFAYFLGKSGDYQGVLDVIGASQAVTNPQALALYLDALAGQKKWQAIVEILAMPKLPILETHRELFLALAQGQLGNREASLAAWDKALAAARGDYAALSAVLTLALQQKEFVLADAAFPSLLESAPEALRLVCYQSWVTANVQNGRLDSLLKVLTQMQTEFPQNSLVEDSLIYYNALAATPGNWVVKAYNAASKNPSSTASRITLSLALLKDNQSAKALEVIKSARISDWSKAYPSWQFVHAGVLKANGLEVPDLKLWADKVLPQERALLY